MKPNLLKSLAILIICATLATITGCSWSIGGGKERASTTQTTRGQELIDLKRARDQGAITQEEYENQKRQVLAR